MFQNGEERGQRAHLVKVEVETFCWQLCIKFDVIIIDHNETLEKISLRFQLKGTEFLGAFSKGQVLQKWSEK